MHRAENRGATITRQINNEPTQICIKCVVSARCGEIARWAFAAIMCRWFVGDGGRIDPAAAPPLWTFQKFSRLRATSTFAAARLRTRLLQPPSCDVYLKQMCPVCFISVSERAQKTRVKTTGVNFDEPPRITLWRPISFHCDLVWAPVLTQITSNGR
jgi:hypothetical protein